jgi:BASS family bile acid:Na+ symporter
MSNFLVYLARANAALSVTLTAVGSLLGVVVTPVLVAGGFAVLLGESAQVQVPVVRIILQLVLLTLLPLGIGMALRGRRESVAIALEPAARRAAGLVIAAIVAAVVVLQWDAMLRLLPVVGSLAALFTLASMGAGWCLSKLGGMPPADRFAVLIEFSIRNVALAAVIGGTSLGRIDLVIVAAVYFVVEIPMAFVAVWLFRRWGSPDGIPQPARVRESTG